MLAEEFDGRHIVTGDDTGVELQLSPGVMLNIHKRSKVVYFANARDGESVDLSLASGLTCIHSTVDPVSDGKLVIDIVERIRVTFRHPGKLCVMRTLNSASVFLWAGNVQIVHDKLENMIVLGEPGSEYRVDDNGQFQLVMFDPTTDVLATERVILTEVRGDAVADVAADSAGAEKPIDPHDAARAILDIVDEIVSKPEIDAETVSADITDKQQGDGSVDGLIKNAITDSESDTGELATAKTKQPANPGNSQSKFEYTVYLFSTRSIGVAEKANQKLRGAGLESEIIEHVSDGIKRYRVAQTGFESHRAAKDFARSITGRLGVGDTWIGKGKTRREQ